MTCLITHVIGGEKTKVWIGSMFRVTTLKLVKLGTVCEGIVAVLSRKSEDVGIVGSAGTFRGVRKKESRPTPKEDVDDRAEWSSSNEMFGDDRLIVTIVHVGGERCRSCVLDEGSIDVCECFIHKTNRDPGCDDKTGMVSYGFCGFKDGTARIPVFIDTNGTIVCLGALSEKLTRFESVGLGTLMAQE